MKTAISIPDTLFQAAEEYAHEHGISRSELYARAVQLYLRMHQANDITAALDLIYETEPSAIDPALKVAQVRALPKDEW
jgi:metal-responsive CopG/Arc/MetJ family transcriptional regulator